MSIHTILYAASGGSAGHGAAELACRLARQFGAHVEGFHVRVDPRQAALAFGDGFGSPVVGDLIERTAQEVAEAAARAKQQFDQSVSAHGLPLRSDPPTLKPGEPVAVEATAAWREETGFAGDLVPRRARLFDLVVLGRSERVVDQPHTDVLEDTLMHCGRPVLLAPAQPPKELGVAVAIAWNASAEAARAVAGALPFLRHAKAVHVLTAGATDPSDGSALVQSLAWRGIAATARHRAPLPGVSVGQQLLAAAREENADLLVMGGYGKAPWREMLLGGATRQVLGSSLLPILIAH
ncbi:MAG TPA: universal stress protein [Stellaceae bacterium]|jgi:nucleotide-binding universal stress UspA family protein|nr:universal stress protein [Stellaceae bacterium]